MYSQAEVKAAIHSLASDRYNMLLVLCQSDEQVVQPRSSLPEPSTSGLARTKKKMKTLTKPKE